MAGLGFKRGGGGGGGGVHAHVHSSNHTPFDVRYESGCCCFNSL